MWLCGFLRWAAMKEERICQIESCSEVLTGKQVHYCSLAHRRLAAGFRPRVPQAALGDVAEALAALLREDRGNGLPFDEVWDEDVQAVVRSHVDESSRQEWIEAVDRSKPIWRLGWNRARTIEGSALAQIWWPFALGLADQEVAA